MEEEQLHEMFNEENNGDDLTINQTYNALCICGKDPIPTQVAVFFENEGVGDEGGINFEQFKRLYDSISEQSVDDLAEAFKVFDRDGNGTIDKEELREILKRREDVDSKFTVDLDDETIEGILQAVDSYGNNDQSVDYKELATYLMDNKSLLPSGDEQQ